jgi:hypothetical protein
MLPRPPCCRYENPKNADDGDERVIAVWAYAMGLLGGSDLADLNAKIARLYDYTGTLVGRDERIARRLPGGISTRLGGNGLRGCGQRRVPRCLVRGVAYVLGQQAFREQLDSVIRCNSISVSRRVNILERRASHR